MYETGVTLVVAPVFFMFSNLTGFDDIKLNRHKIFPGLMLKPVRFCQFCAK
jgi:hypothetical protein